MSEASAISRASAAPRSSEPAIGDARDFWLLLKPRVMSLVVFTGLIGMVLAPAGTHPVLAAVALLCIAVGAGASAAINMWYDADIDAVMTRTQNRPVPAGRVAAGDALGFGATLAVGSVLVMGLAVNLTAAALLALTIGFYVFVYTMWLKRRTPQNIVIGGAAGALPPVIGWAAMSGEVGLEAIVLFAIIFMWTPPHFWALSLFRSADYAAAGVPMLPVVAGERATRRHIVLYAILLFPIALGPWAIGLSGVIYGAGAVLLGAGFVALGIQLLRAPAGDVRVAKALFGYSIVYMFSLFALLAIDKGMAGVW